MHNIFNLGISNYICNSKHLLNLEYVCSDDSEDEGVDASCWSNGACQGKSCNCNPEYSGVDCSGNLLIKKTLKCKHKKSLQYDLFQCYSARLQKQSN